MGCTNSKVDDLPAVALCRERCQFLEEAIRQRYAFANAHVAYIRSLEQIGLSLHRFFDQDLDYSASPPSPVLPLPTRRKGDTLVTATATATAAASVSSPPAAVVHHSHSNSGSHLHFHSDSDDDELHSGSGNSSPLHSPSHDHYDYSGKETLDSIPGGHMTMNFMKKQATPSTVYQQHRPETVHMGESSSYDPYSYPSNYPSSSYDPYPNNYPGGSYPYYGYPPYGSSSPPAQPPAGDFASKPYPYYGSPAYGSSSPPPRPAEAASSSKPPPPPPSPPRNSPWDFLNPFEAFDKYYSAYTPSRDSKDVREEEGIPDLEDEDYEHEVVKQVHGDQKVFSGAGNYSKMVADEDKAANDGEEKGGAEYEVHSDSVAKEKQPRVRDNVTNFKAGGGSRGVSEIMTTIRAQFEKASLAGKGVSKLLEVGALPYHRRGSVHKVSSKMLHMITPPLAVVSSHSKTAESSSSGEKGGSVLLEFDKDMGTRSRSLSSSLQRLQIWEKKLHDEVKSEEKMRVIHERKKQKLKRLDERGAEAHKIDSTQTLIRTLSTKIRIAIQFVDKISVKINKLRDEDLWPQLNELTQELVRMWKIMFECHQIQCQAMTEAKNLDAIASNKKLSDSHLEAAMKLEMELIDWTSSFSKWISAQKGFVRALNGWLLKCLPNEPEETPDGIAPFSPGRLGAPPVFVICNQWSHAMDTVSEKEVIYAMRVFVESVLRLHEQHSLDLRQRTMADRNVDMKVKNLEKEELKIQKAIQALNKQTVPVSGEGNGLPIPGFVVHQSDNINVGSLQSGLKQIFEAMERFADHSMQAYEELQKRTEEEKLARENAKIP